MDLSTAYDSLLTDMGSALSLVLLTVVGLVLVVVDAFRNNDRSLPWIGIATLAVGIVWEVGVMAGAPGTAFHEMIRVGGFASFINVVLMGSALFTIVLSRPYLDTIHRNYGEVYALILFATVGMIVLGTANNLVTVFVGLETMSICLYIMTGLVRDDGATESALKYFLLGAFSTGFFLYGIALLYGATATMSLPDMAAGLAASGNSVMFWAGVGLLLVGFMFKVSAAPFHMWTPDVYQGAPTPLVGFMSTASKASAFASLILILFYALPNERWGLVLAVIAVVTMVLGNLVALAQTNMKRLLAYSSIAHAGYVLVGLAAGSPAGYSGALYYLLVYSLMNIGAFGVLAILEWDGHEGRIQDLDSLSGIGLRKPFLGVMMGVFMFSLSGFPPLGGFIGKYAVFAPAVDAGYTWLVIVGVLASSVSAYYYLRVLYVFWMKSPDNVPRQVSDAAFPVPTASAIVLASCAVLLLILGILPDLLGVAQSYFQAVPGTMAIQP